MSNEYLNHIRKNSAYPTFRNFLAVLSGIGVLIAILVGGSGLFIGNGSIFFTIVVGALIFIFNKIAVEVSLMVADTADATVDKASRNWEKPVEVMVEQVGVSVATQSVEAENSSDETKNCPKCGWTNFSDAKKCVACKTEMT